VFDSEGKMFAVRSFMMVPEGLAAEKEENTTKSGM
jgi:hypothetical protein